MSKLTLFDLPSCPKKGRTACWSYNPWKSISPPLFHLSTNV